MHLFDPDLSFMGGYAIVGGQFPIACGLAFASKFRKEDRIAACFFGDGAVNQGTFHEGLNWARLWELPVLFVCENNFYGIGTEVHRSSALADIHKRTCGYDIPSEKVDGMDVIAVYQAVKQAAEWVREQSAAPTSSRRSPTASAAIPWPTRGNTGARPRWSSGRSATRSRISRSACWRRGSPGRGCWTRSRSRLQTWCEEAVKFAEESPWPEDAKSSTTFLCESDFTEDLTMPEMTYRDALNLALKEEMRRDPSVVIWGEDVALYEGSFKVTRGLLAEFGEERVQDTPISENTIVGVAVGAAMGGLRPVAELMTVNFALLAMDQIVNHMTKIRYMFGGQVNLPMVIRAPGGGGSQLAAQHSQSLETFFMHCARHVHRGTGHAGRRQGAPEERHPGQQSGHVPGARAPLQQQGGGVRRTRNSSFPSARQR